jgi:Carboxypeptidase regulatory-like domain
MLLAYPRRGPSPSRATDPDFAMIPLSLTDGDIAGLAVTLRQGPNVSGRIEFEGEPPGSRIGVWLDSLDTDSTTAGDPDTAGTGMVLVRSVRPVARATVAVMAAIADKEPVGETTADDRGAFTIRGLPAGQFSIVVAKPGYVDVRSLRTSSWRKGLQLPEAAASAVQSV